MAKPAPMDVFLLPGEFFVGDEGYQIRTIWAPVCPSPCGIRLPG